MDKERKEKKKRKEKEEENEWREREREREREEIKNGDFTSVPTVGARGSEKKSRSTHHELCVVPKS